MFKYILNEEIFEKINDETSAYLLGLIIADGCIHQNYIRIELGEPIEYMKMLANCFYINKDAHFYYPKKHKPHYRQQISFKVYRKKITDDLLKLEITPNKTFTVKLPKIKNKKLYRCIIRGIYDGDGCIYYCVRPPYKLKQFYCGIACNKHMAIQIQTIVEKETNIHMGNYKAGSIREIKIGGNNQVKKFLDWLYKDATIYLPRKYEKYQDLKKQQEKKNKKLK